MQVHRSGLIEILSGAARRMGLERGRCRVSFLEDGEGDVFVRLDGDGLRPCSTVGASLYRYFSARTARRILALSAVPPDVSKAGFRIGEPDDGKTFPIITRRAYLPTG